VFRFWVSVFGVTGAKLLMLKLVYDGTANETVATLYIDGSLATPLGAASASGNITNAGPTTIDGVNLYGYNKDTADNTLDEVRLGDTKADVIPEPTVLSLFGLIGLVYLLRKKLHHPRKSS